MLLMGLEKQCRNRDSVPVALPARGSWHPILTALEKPTYAIDFSLLNENGQI